MSQPAPLLQVEDLKVHFPIRGGLWGHAKGWVKAVDGISLEVRQAETFGVVGESGCGKSTLGYAILGLEKPTAGRVIFAGRDLTALDRRERSQLARHLQVVFQDPVASLNPKLTVAQSVGEPLMIHQGLSGQALAQRVGELLEMVGLAANHADRYPHQFSGGQRQRLVIARALALKPKLVVCDEPVSALDVSVQSQVLNLMVRLQKDLGLAYLFISHDLSVVRHVSDRVGVVYLGRMVETAPTLDLYQAPSHPYTVALMSAIPHPDPLVQRQRQRLILKGELPSPAHQPPGCAFHLRCWRGQEICKQERPELRELAPGHWAACHFPVVDQPGLEAPRP